MKIEGQISILINQDSTTIEVRDKNASINFIEIRLTPEQLSSALSRLMYTNCEIEVRSIDLVGKKHHHETFAFKLPEGMSSANKDEELQAAAQALLKDGWIADCYFRSQNSFWEKDGEKWARVTIRRWI